MTTALPFQVALQPGEMAQAIIHRDWRVQVLGDMLKAVFGLGATVVGLMALDLTLQRPLLGIRTGLFTTIALLAAPLLAQRWVGGRPPYVLTNRRLIIGTDDWIDLHQIQLIRVWLTCVSLQSGMRHVWLQHLVNPPSTALLIRNVAAGEGQAK